MARVRARMPPMRLIGGLYRIITWPIEQAIKHLLN